MCFRSVLALAALVAVCVPACAQEKLRVSVPQRGLWDTGVAELGQRAGSRGDGVGRSDRGKNVGGHPAPVSLRDVAHMVEQRFHPGRGSRRIEGV